MATNTTQNASNGRASIGRVELREIPLSRIVVPEGFNPRGEVVHDAELEAMAETMRQRGCLQPVRVRVSETGTDEYLLIAGERRYHAAAIAALTQLPAVVLPAGAGDEAEHLDLLTDAMIENEVRCELNPLQRALGFRAMIEHGLNVRGVAERMGGKAKRSSREKRIREHLTILTLPEKVRTLVAAGEVPMLAVKALAELAAIHEELPAYAIAAVLDTDNEYSEPYTWPEVTESALKVALSHCEVLPAGLFLSSQGYPLDTFELGEKAKKDLAAYEKLVGRTIVAMRFSFEHIEQARLLGAAHQAGYGTLIVGEDVATSLAEDYIADVLKEARAQARCQREAEKERQAAGGSDAEGTSGDAGQPEGSGEGESTGQDAEAQREAERKKREKAIRFNLDLGVLAFKHLPKIKVDERVLRILASVDLARSLREIASRGARLSLPGWVTQTEQRNEKMKTTYMETYEAEARAAGFLAGAESAGDIAGRTLTLVALASLANEDDAVPQSRRSYHRLAFRGPWAVQAERDLNAIVRERIKEGQLPALDAILGKRIAKDEQAVAREQEIASASARLESSSGRLAELDEKELDQALSDAELAWGKHSPKTRELRTEIDAVREQRAAAKAGEHEHTDEQAAVAA
ncbi:MAG TPA: ParB/RepB/Spo0J family partition protein [Solirubrobacteraceae bacterium]|nr:ParB/RepB/Spo0J family partition protein [Solirubrobacteraceae bacterium]